MTTLAQPFAPTTQTVEDLYQHHASYLRRIVRLRVRHDEAEDIEQEVWLAVVIHLPQFRGQSHVRTWLAHIAVNAVLMWARRKRIRKWVPLTTAREPETLPRPLEKIDLANRLRHLSLRQRQALILHDVCGIPHHEIAKRLGIAISTSVRRLIAARRTLSKLNGREENRTHQKQRRIHTKEKNGVLK